jgi:hypothetical protein
MHRVSVSFQVSDGTPDAKFEFMYHGICKYQTHWCGIHALDLHYEGSIRCRISVGTPAILSEVLYNFHPGKNDGIIPWLGHYRFLPNPFQFVICQPCHHSASCSWEALENNPLKTELLKCNLEWQVEEQIKCIPEDGPIRVETYLFFK